MITQFDDQQGHPVKFNLDNKHMNQKLTLETDVNLPDNSIAGKCDPIKSQIDLSGTFAEFQG